MTLQGPSCSYTAPVMTNIVPAKVSADEQRALFPRRVTTVQVTIGADGKVTAAKVYQSSGLAFADEAAVAAARASSYQAATQDCHAIAQNVLFDEVVRPDYALLAENCSIPDKPATVLKEAKPIYPESARELRASGMAAVQVTIGPGGELAESRIARSAANMALDQAALDAARESIYAPKIVHCIPVKAEYLFKVTFFQNG
jgi:TonB family protein